jgi:hypothetical protein
MRATVYIVTETETDEGPHYAIERRVESLDVDTAEAFRRIVGQAIVDERGDVGVEFGPIGESWT